MASSTRLITRPSRKASNTMPRRRSYARLTLPVLACGLILTGALAMFRRPVSPDTIFDVIRRVHATALHRPTYPGMDDGGPIGRWWIAAAESDPSAGVLRQVRLVSEGAELMAREARVVVDPWTDSISIELTDVVFTILDETNSADAEGGGVLTPVEYHVIGPIRWLRDIVPDGRKESASRLTVHD